MERALCAAALALAATLAAAFCLATPEDDFNCELTRARQLDEALARNLQMREERFRIIAELEVGSITLEQAIERFRPLNQYEPVCWEFIGQLYPEHTTEERIGYQMMVAAYALPPEYGVSRTEFLPALACALTERFGDRVVLPAHLQEHWQD